MSDSHQPQGHGNGHGNGAKHDGHDDDHSLKEKIKHPFHDLKQKLEGTHLHNLKVGLTHKKCALPLPFFFPTLTRLPSHPSSPGRTRTDAPFSVGIKLENSQTW